MLACLYGVFFLSGAAGLGYQIVWTRMWATGLGHEVSSMLAVVAAFFGGMAVGAALLDGPISRSARPGRWYVGLEVLIGVWALATIAIIPWGSDQVARLTGVLPSSLRHWLVAFGLPFAGLLPATAAMGATLPAMDRIVSRLRGGGRNVGGLYAVNTLGAMAGTLGAAFFLVPALGMSNTVLGFAALNLLSAAAVAVACGPGAVAAERPEVTEERDSALPRPRLLATLAVTGALGIGYEMLGVRVIGQVLENTVYSFACALAIYLLGTALGAAIYQRAAPGSATPGSSNGRAAFDRVLTVLLNATCIACLVGVFAMAGAESVYGVVAAEPGFWRAVAAELALAAAVFLVPTALMGATFAHLAQGVRRERGGVGLALAINTLGGSLAPPLFGVLLLPAVGAKWSLVGVAIGYLLLLPRKSPIALAPGAAALAVILVASPSLRLVTPLPGGRVVEYREGVMASVAVVTDELGNKHLKVNDRFRMGSSVDGFGERRLGHLPLLLHPAPKRTLYLGLGAGTPFYTAGRHPGLEARCVELLREVVELREHFATPEELLDADLSVVTADARRYVRATPESFDVIVGGLFHPARDGSGSLYTREHFLGIRERLAADGLFCQWLPLFQLDPEALRIIVRTFLDVYPDARAYLPAFNVEHPVIGLVGRTRPLTFGPTWYGERVAEAELRGALERVVLRNIYQLLGCYLADSAALAEFAGDGPLNLDDRPLVTYLAARHVYARSQPAADNLRALLELRSDPGELIAAGPGRAEAVRRLREYSAARDLHLFGELESSPDRRLESLLSSVAASRDFVTSYDVLLQDVEKEAHLYPDVARQLLDFLIQARPEQPRARALRAELFGY